MKFRPNKHYTGIAIYAFLVLAAVIIFYEGVQNIDRLSGYFGAAVGFIQPVVYGFVFAYLLNPLLRLYDDKLLRFLSRDKLKPGTRRTLALVLTYPTVIIAIIAFVAVVVPQLVESIETLFNNVPSYIRALEELYTTITNNMKDYQLLNEGAESDALMNSVISMVIGTTEGLLEQAYEYLTGLVPQILTASAKFTTSIINILLGIIISIYFLFDREKLFAQARKIATAIFPQRATTLFYDIAMDSHRVFSGFISGKVIDSIIIGILCFVGMTILRLPYAVLISVIVGVTNIIPYFGPFIGAIPGILIILIDDPIKALWFAIFILLLQQFDGNVLGPKILGDTTGLSALWVIFAIMLFNGVFGVLGMFIGVPLFAVIYNLIKRIVGFFLRKKELSTNTRDYASDKNPLIK